VQTIGRAARNADGQVILYADKETKSIIETVTVTERRREMQGRYNEEHGITPTTIVKRISSLQDSIWESDYVTVPRSNEQVEPDVPNHRIPEVVKQLRKEMAQAARDLEFEVAADIRDRIKDLEDRRIRLG
jgi:excinuclease ABC subunit B